MYNVPHRHKKCKRKLNNCLPVRLNQGNLPSLYGVTHSLLEIYVPMAEEIFYKEIFGLGCRGGRGLRMNIIQ